MIKPILLAMACLAATTEAFALPFGVVELVSGGRIEFHSTPGICTGPASEAVYVAKDGATVIGCWTYQPGPAPALIVWFVDGDAARIPVGAIRAPKTS